MATEYENVSERAAEEVMFNRTETAYDLSQRSRVMPPPLNTLVFVMTMLVWMLNLIVSVISPRANLYAYLNHSTFQKLSDNRIPIERSNYFLTMSRGQVCQWFFGRAVRWIPFCRDSISKENCGNIHHKRCYGVMIVHGKDKSKSLHAVSGMSMTDYIDKFQSKHNQDLDPKDKAKLKQLTPNTLFCSHCFQPFSVSDYEDELTSPAIALLDMLSAVTFVMVPIAYIPLVIALAILSIYDEFSEWIGDETPKQPFTNSDFDREYFPAQFDKKRETET